MRTRRATWPWCQAGLREREGPRRTGGVGARATAMVTTAPRRTPTRALSSTRSSSRTARPSPRTFFHNSSPRAETHRRWRAKKPQRRPPTWLAPWRSSSTPAAGWLSRLATLRQPSRGPGSGEAAAEGEARVKATPRGGLGRSFGSPWPCGPTRWRWTPRSKRQRPGALLQGSGSGLWGLPRRTSYMRAVRARRAPPAPGLNSRAEGWRVRRRLRSGRRTSTAVSWQGCREGGSDWGASGLASGRAATARSSWLRPTV
mmetsp:Transcript_7807/g.26885  ORF Transcript_7807/g.26885 Transcript_7807/m.26885 type:complete len:258 (-) Transcript_7807:1162-1935(-)